MTEKTMKPLIAALFLFISILISIPEGFASDMVFTAKLEETFDDNVYSAEDNSDESIEMDFITGITLSLGVESQRKRSYLNFLGNIFYKKYLSHADLDSFSQDLSLFYTYNLTATDTIEVVDSFTHYPEPQTFQETFFRSGSDDAYYSNNADISWKKDFFKFLKTSTHYNYLFNRSLGDTTEDSDQHQAGVEIDYYINSINIISLGYNYYSTSYESGNSITTHEPLAKYKFHFTDRLYLLGTAGYDIFAVNIQSDNNLQERSKPFFSLSLTDELNRKSTLSITYSNKYSMSVDNADLYNYQTLSALFIYELSRRLNSNLEFFWGSGTYEISKDDYKLAAMSISFNYELTKFISTGLEISSTFYEIKRNTISISASGKF